MKIILAILSLIGLYIILLIIGFITYHVFKYIHYVIVKKEVQKILDKSRNDEQFLDIIYNTFKLKGKQ